MLESKIESYFVEQVKKAGGMCLKFESPSMRGVPDRIVLFAGCAYFVELKAPGKVPRPNQELCHSRFAAVGVPVYVIDSKAGAQEFCTHMLRAARGGEHHAGVV